MDLIWHSRCSTSRGMEQQRGLRRSKTGTRRRSHRTVARSGFDGIVPQIVPLGILAVAVTAFGNGAKGLVWPPPGFAGSLVLFLVAVTFFVVGACMWFVLGVFTDPRFMRTAPRARVKLAGEALGPVLEILGLLHKSSTKLTPAT